MTPPRPRGRPVPKGRREAHYAAPPESAGAPVGTPAAGDATGASGAPPAGASFGSRALRPGSRAQNRAAKRAASPRPKPRPQRRNSNAGLIGVLAAAVVIGVAAIALANPFGSPGASASASPGASATLGVSPYGDGTCPTKQPAVLAVGQKRTVTIETSLGNIILEVDGSLSPIAAGNFVALAECEYYDGLKFHRTAALQDGTPFVIQGGDPKGDGTGGPGYTIADEPIKTTYRRGTLAMARSSAPNSQGSQFFIVLDDKAVGPLASVNTYAIFGSVVSGMEVADAIFKASNGAETPASPIVMTSVTVAGAPAASPSVAPSGGTPAPTTAPTTAPTVAPSASTP